MPTADRRPRRRLKPKEAEHKTTLHDLYEQARSATPEDWDNGLRRRFVRHLVDHRGLTQEIAASIARAFERKPYLIPMRPPRPAHPDH